MDASFPKIRSQHPVVDLPTQDLAKTSSNELSIELRRLREEEQTSRDREREAELVRLRELAKFD